MRDATDPAGALLRLSRPTLVMLVAMLALGAVVLADWYKTKYASGAEALLIDFDIFHLVGRLAWQGDLFEAYRFDLFEARQVEMTGSSSFMPWTYPPTFDLVAALLALLPLWVAYLVFVLGTMGAYLAVLRRLAGAQFGAAFLPLLPVFVLVIVCGQNGFLTGALLGLFALGAWQERRWAGLPLGLMVVKPHLALGLGAYLLLARRWGWLGQAVAVAAAMAGVATLAFGPGVWPAFLHGVRESGAFLEEGAYPLQRMTSLYAGLRSFGLPSRLAFGVHGAVALGALAVVALALAQGWRRERTLAAALLATLLVSPYNYDYDLPILGLVFALAFRTLGGGRSRGTAGLAVLAGAYPLAVSLVPLPEALKPWLMPDGRIVALAPFAVVALAAILLRTMWRDERAGRRGVAEAGAMRRAGA